MSTEKGDRLWPARKDGKVAVAAGAREESKLAEARAGPERQVCISPGVTALTDNTKRFRLSNSRPQAIRESSGVPQQKSRKPSGPSLPAEEKPKKSFFSVRLAKGKKEKYAPHDKASLAEQKPALTAPEDSASCAERTREEATPTFPSHQDRYSMRGVKLQTPSALSPMESSADYEEDLYRDAEEIEREKVLLVCETSPSENKLSVAPEVDILDYCRKEWRGTTLQAKRMRKGYESVSQKFISIRRVRGDNYCAVRATLFQALSQAVELPDWIQDKDLMLLPEKLMVKYNWITEWQFRQKLTGNVENLTDEIKGCLLLLKREWEKLSEIKTLADRQAACDELFRSEADEYSLFEAVKFLMLNTAIKLHEDNEKGKEVPMFSWLLFARDTSSNPAQLMKNHLNQLGHTGGLEQVEMFLLAYTLQHTIQVYRLYKHSTDEFITLYPNDPDQAWPTVTLITEDDRHYNIPVRLCEETSL